MNSGHVILGFVISMGAIVVFSVSVLLYDIITSLKNWKGGKHD